MSSAGQENGFTYFELIMVAAIIAVLTGIAFPRLRTAFAKYQLENFVKTLYYSAHYLETSAASEGRIYCLRIDRQTGQILPVYKNNGEFKNLAGRFSRPFVPPDGVEFSTEKEAICFYPDSSNDPAQIDFENREKDKVSLIFQGASGGVQIQ